MLTALIPDLEYRISQNGLSQSQRQQFDSAVDNRPNMLTIGFLSIILGLSGNAAIAAGPSQKLNPVDADKTIIIDPAIYKPDPSVIGKVNLATELMSLTQSNAMPGGGSEDKPRPGDQRYSLKVYKKMLNFEVSDLEDNDIHFALTKYVKPVKHGETIVFEGPLSLDLVAREINNRNIGFKYTKNIEINGKNSVNITLIKEEKSIVKLYIGNKKPKNIGTFYIGHEIIDSMEKVEYLGESPMILKLKAKGGLFPANVKFYYNSMPKGSFDKLMDYSIRYDTNLTLKYTQMANNTGNVVIYAEPAYHAHFLVIDSSRNVIGHNCWPTKTYIGMGGSKTVDGKGCIIDEKNFKDIKEHRLITIKKDKVCAE